MDVEMLCNGHAEILEEKVLFVFSLVWTQNNHTPYKQASVNTEQQPQTLWRTHTHKLYLLTHEQHCCRNCGVGFDLQKKFRIVELPHYNRHLNVKCTQMYDDKQECFKAQNNNGSN